MKLGLHISNYTWDGGAATLAPTLTRIATLAEDVGFDNLTVMDHLWQIRGLGPTDAEMLEAYTALGYLAAATKRVELSTMVTAVSYRSPGLLAKAVTTLDVLSGGRAWLGIGSSGPSMTSDSKVSGPAWNEEEAIGLGLSYPPTAVRFEMLEETLQICLQMWSKNDGPYEGEHYRLRSTLNSPQPIQRPRPRIMIAGDGEKKTLRMVAQYADGCNIFLTPEVGHKLDVLREHCARLERDYDTIEKTTNMRIDVGQHGQHVPPLLEKLRGAFDAGFTSVHATVTNVGTLTPLEILGRDIIPIISAW